MAVEEYTIVPQLPSDLYYDILDYAIGTSTQFSLVVRDVVGLSSRGIELLENLKRFLVRDYRSNKWPGTELIDTTARIVECHYMRESKDILKKAARNIYDWRQPDLPEDLCLLRSSGDVWMASTSHENDAFFEMEPDELKAMLRRIPSLGDYLRVDRNEETETRDLV